MWKDLTMGQKADIMNMAAKQGIINLNQIQQLYDSSISENSDSYSVERQLTPEEELQQQIANFDAAKEEYIYKQKLEREDNKYAYGGPISNWYNNVSWKSKNRNPEEIKRNVYRGPYKNAIDWDKTKEGKLINYSENRDSIGYNPKLKIWNTPNLQGYDTNNIGMGIDINTNPYIKNYLKFDNDKNPYLTEQDEKELRYKSISDAEKSYYRRLNYAQKTLKSDKVPSINKKAATMSAIYNLGSSYVSKTIFNNTDAMDALLNGTDNDYISYINKEYSKKGRNERIKLQDNLISNDYNINFK